MSDTLQRLMTALGERYAIQREIGAGGMATVYLAKDLRHGRPVAIKVVRPELGGPGGIARFLRVI
jgi:serine/threonine-protein kinase